MNITARDIFKAVAAALAISFITYVVTTSTDALLKNFGVSFQRTAVLDKTGYLIQFDNDTWNALPMVTVSATRRLNVEATSADNGVQIQTTQLHSPDLYCTTCHQTDELIFS